MENIPFLKRGDRVALAAPARAVSPKEMAPAIAMLESWGLQVIVSKGLYEQEGQLAGSDRHRAAFLQELLDAPDIKAIFCCRGGYGTVRIIDRLDFKRFAEHPKWIVGYSDITVLHSHIHNTLGLRTPPCLSICTVRRLQPHKRCMISSSARNTIMWTTNGSLRR